MSTDLGQITSWEPGEVRRATDVLAEVAERLPGWRVRLEGVGRQLQAATSWSGPSATRASDVVVQLSDVATAVGSAWDVSLAALQLLVGQAQAAHDLAIEARCWAASIGARLGPTGMLDRPVAHPAATMAPDQLSVVAAESAAAVRAVAVAAEAQRHGALADAAAAQARDALAAVGVTGSRAPARFADLARVVPVPAGVPVAPPGSSAFQVAAWWAGLSAGAQLLAIRDDAATVGRLEGVPAWARDSANRLLLERALAAPGAAEEPFPITVAGQLAAAEATGRHAQLWEFDPAAGLAAVAVGDLDSADAVGVLVPGMNTTVVDDLGSLLTDAEGVAHAAGGIAPMASVAVLAWIGYRTPQGLGQAIHRSAARHAAPVLAGDLVGLAAARAATGSPLPRTTVLAHSYGAVLVDEAADRPGPLAADAVVLLGSPGMEGDGDLRREVPEVYDAVGGLDPIAVSGWFGEQPWESGYGATLLPTDLLQTHTEYYDADHPTLAALGAVVAGAD